MGIAIVNSVSAGSVDGSQPLTTAAIDTTGATAIIVAMCVYQPLADSLITDNKGNGTYSNLAFWQNASVAPAVQLWYKENPIVGAGHTFTADATGHPSDFPSIAVIAISGSATVSITDGENGATTTASASLQTGNVTPTQDNGILVTCVGINTTGTGQSINGGFTIQESVAYVNGAHMGIKLAYLIQAAAAAANPTWSWTGTDQAAVGIAAFKAAAGAAVGFLLVSN